MDWLFGGCVLGWFVCACGLLYLNVILFVCFVVLLCLTLVGCWFACAVVLVIGLVLYFRLDWLRLWVFVGFGVVGGSILNYGVVTPW